jgi:hypothetical protein
MEQVEMVRGVVMARLDISLLNGKSFPIFNLRNSKKAGFGPAFFEIDLLTEWYYYISCPEMGDFCVRLVCHPCGSRDPEII